jgi:translation initiation factor IF-2
VAKVRVYELAKELGVESKTLLSHLKEQGEFVRSASSTIEPPVVRKVRESFPAELAGDGAAAQAKNGAAKPAASQTWPGARRRHCHPHFASAGRGSCRFRSCGPHCTRGRTSHDHNGGGASGSSPSGAPGPQGTRSPGASARCQGFSQSSSPGGPCCACGARGWR